jgi:hypothetical protein
MGLFANGKAVFAFQGDLWANFVSLQSGPPHIPSTYNDLGLFTAVDECGWSEEADRALFGLGMVFAVGLKNEKRWALEALGLSTLPVPPPMPFANGHDWGEEMYWKIRNGKQTYVKGRGSW